MIKLLELFIMGYMAVVWVLVAGVVIVMAVPMLALDLIFMAGRGISRGVSI